MYALPEKTKRGPPTKKNISIRNIMAQISNMSANENAGFKSEYHVRYLLKTYCSIYLQCVFIVKLKVKKYKYFKQLYTHLNTLSTGYSSWRALSMHRGEET